MSAPRINWSNPITQKLNFAHQGRDGVRNLVQGKPGATLSSGTLIPRNQGFEIDAPVEIYLPPSAFGVGTSIDHDCSGFVVADLRKRAVANEDMHFFHTDQSNALADTLMYIDNTGTDGELTAWDDPNKVKVTDPEPDVTAGVMETFAFTYLESANQLTLYLNGGPALGGGSDYGTLQYNSTINANGLSYLSLISGKSQLEAVVYAGFVWSRRLRTSEIVSLARNPWQLFRPRTIYLPGAPAAAPLLVFPWRRYRTTQP